MKIARLIASAPDAIDRVRLDAILEAHGLSEKWRNLLPTLR